MKIIRSFTVLLLGSINALFAILLLLVAYSPYIQPTVHPVRSCLGLSFPIFLLANVFFLLFWLVVRQYKVALLPLCCMLLCYGQIRTYLPINFRFDPLPENCLKVLSYNVMSFGGCTKKDGKNPILTYLQQSEADILCLQEFATNSSRRFLTQADIDRELKAYPYKHIDKLGNSSESFNRVACYSKYPILSVRKLRYASSSNGSVAYELKIGSDTVLLINNHLESNKLTAEDKKVYEGMWADPGKDKVKSGSKLLIRKLAEASAIRAVQADSVARFVQRSRHAFIIVCGDFNDTPISYTHRVVGQNLYDAFTQSGQGLGISYNQNKFYFRIDHILVSKNLRTYHCSVDNRMKDSDHYPIWCYITKKE